MLADHVGPACASAWRVCFDDRHATRDCSTHPEAHRTPETRDGHDHHVSRDVTCVDSRSADQECLRCRPQDRGCSGRLVGGSWTAVKSDYPAARCSYGSDGKHLLRSRTLLARFLLCGCSAGCFFRILAVSSSNALAQATRRGEGSTPLLGISVSSSGGVATDAAAPPETLMGLLHSSEGKLHTGFNRVFLRRCWRLVKEGIHGPLVWRAVACLIMNFFAGVGMFAINLAAAPFVDASMHGNGSAALLLFVVAGSAFALVTLLNVATQYAGELVRLRWRQNLVRVFHERYYRGRAAYWLNNVNGTIDNADQRITEDIDQFTIFAGVLLFSNFRSYGSFVFVIGQNILSISYVVTRISSLVVFVGIG
jgi:ABC transporter transmembrane region 2